MNKRRQPKALMKDAVVEGMLKKVYVVESFYDAMKKAVSIIIACFISVN